jgi:uncharacterized protein
VSFIELTSFGLDEDERWKRLWFRGGFPRSFLARGERTSHEWRKAYIGTFLERDIPNLGIQIPPQALRRFWLMTTHYHGQIFNASELGRSLGLSDVTVRRYLDLLTGTFMLRQLLPWTENLGKRLVRTPKIYFRDSGLFHTLLGLDRPEQLFTHPKLGPSWEGFALESLMRLLEVEDGEGFFWATHNQAELDLLIFRGTKRYGFEFKYSDAPRITRSMRIALEDLRLDRLFLVHPGTEHFPLAPTVEAIGLGDSKALQNRLKRI